MATAAPNQNLPLFYSTLEPLNATQHGKMKIHQVDKSPMIANTHAIPVTVDQTPGTSTAAVSAAAVCSILHLDLGPLTLNVLGLQVDLSRVVLDITAIQGAGNLLGNLLCAVAGLLDNPSGLATLLNQILAALGL